MDVHGFVELDIWIKKRKVHGHTELDIRIKI